MNIKKILKVLGYLFLALLIIGAFFVWWKVRSDHALYPTLTKKGKQYKQIVIRDVRLFSGRESIAQEHMDIWVKAGKIEKIEPTSTATPTGVYVVDGKGKTLLPGFVDVHVHLTSSGAAPWKPIIENMEYNLQAYLWAGITTVYDLGGKASAIRALKQRVQKGSLLGPRIFHTHTPVTVKGGHPLVLIDSLVPWPLNWWLKRDALLIDDPKDASKIVSTLKQEKVDFLKAVVDELPTGAKKMNKQQLAALIGEAKKQGYRSFVHIGKAEDALMAAKAGADVLAHGVYNGEISEQQAKELAKTGVRVCYTLVGWNGVRKIALGKYQPSKFEYAISPKEILDPITGEKGKQFMTLPALKDMGKTVIRSHRYWNDNVNRLYKAGVPFLIGTDSPLPGVYPGSSFHEELRLLNRAGIPNAYLLQAATYKAALVLKKKPTFGSIEVGKTADLLLVKGNPLQNIEDTKKIDLVFRNGQILHRKQSEN